MTAVRFTPCGHQCAVAFAYNPAVVQLLKDTVPGYARSWSPGRREWEIDLTWAESLAAAIRAAGHTVVGLEPPRPRSNTDSTQWARLLFTRVGPGRTTAVYRALSKCLHPDTPTGDTTLQRELNDAHSLWADRK
jgi:hypothetical protein